MYHMTVLCRCSARHQGQMAEKDSSCPQGSHRPARRDKHKELQDNVISSKTVKLQDPTEYEEQKKELRPGGRKEAEKGQWRF